MSESEQMKCVFHSHFPTGDWMQTLRQTIQTLHSVTDLHAIGFDVDSEVKHKDELRVEDAMASQMWGLIVALLRHRVQSMLWHCTYPMFFAGLLHEDVHTASRCLEQTRLDHEICQELMNRAASSVFLKKIVTRSAVLSTEVSKVVMSMLQETAFLWVPQVCQELLKDIFRGFGQTKVVEDSFHYLRNRESGSIGSIASIGVKRIGPCSAWHCCVKSKVLAQHHRREVSAPEDQQRSKQKCPPPMFRTVGHKPKLADGIQQQPSWPTYNPQSASILCADLPLLRVVHARDLWDQSKNAWVCQVLCAGDLLVVKATQRVVLCLGHIKNMALVWPMVRSSHGSHVLWQLDSSCANNVHELELVVLSFEELEVIPAQCRSPKFFFVNWLP